MTNPKTSDIQPALSAIYDKIESAGRLNYVELKALVSAIRNGEVDSHRFVAILAIMETRNRLKGIDISETADFIRALRYDGMPDLEGIVCTAGTGGDPVKTVNISTAAALVLAAGGLRVMKNGFKSITGKCGSRDILSGWGVDPFLPIHAALESVRHVGIGYYDFANLIVIEERSGFHSPLHYIGALSHPMNVRYKLLGCSDERQFAVIERLADELFDSYLISFNPDIDELSTVSPNRVVEKIKGEKRRYVLNPEDLNIRRASYAGAEALPTPAASAAFLKDVLGGREGAAFDLIALNAAAAFYLCGFDGSIADGIDRSRAILKEGQALETLRKWQDYSRRQSADIRGGQTGPSPRKQQDHALSACDR